MSRSSSVSAKDRSGQGKRKPLKQRRDDSESFDVRSQYTPFFPPQQQPAWVPSQQYGPMGASPYGNVMPPNYQGTASPPSFGPGQQQFHPNMMPGVGVQPYNQMPQPQMQQNHMPPNQMSQPMMIQHPMHQLQMPQMPQMPPMPSNPMMPNQLPQVLPIFYSPSSLIS